MRLSTALAIQTLEQLHEQPEFEDAAVIPDDYPARPQLTELFGDHTFFIDKEGLHIVEPADALDGDARTGQVVKLASWAGADHIALSPHRPEATDLLVRLDSEDRQSGSSEEE